MDTLDLYFINHIMLSLLINKLKKICLLLCMDIQIVTMSSRYAK